MADSNNNNKKRAGIATLSDLRRQQESDSDSDGPQEYYTGGEKSGMMVQDPSKHRKEVDSIFDRAKQFGAEPASQAASSSSSRRSGSGAFTGTGRTLAGSDPVPAPDYPPEPVFHTITFWRNGFTVNDGTLRKLDDPENADFLRSINRGEVPRELDPGSSRIPVHVNLIKQDDDWKAPPEPKYRAFQGAGRTLGTSSTEAAASPVEASTTTNAAHTEGPPPAPSRGVIVDELKPFTTLQLRLVDGTRMVARFNTHHTVGDIRGFIDAARAGGPKSYELRVMGFPPKELTDPSITIQEAGLANAVIIQKIRS